MQIQRMYMTKRSIIFIFITLVHVGFAYGQNDMKKDTILKEIQNYCLDAEMRDTLTIRIGMNMHLGTAYSYFKINKREKQFQIQYINEEQHFEDGVKKVNHSVESNYFIDKPDFLFSLESEMVNCKYGRNKKNQSWNYRIESSDAVNQTFADVYAYSLYDLVSIILNKKSEKPLKEYFCTTDIMWIQKTEIIESYSSDGIKYDTLITESLTCKNGDYAWKTIKDTQKKVEEYNKLSFNLTMDSSTRVQTVAYSYDKHPVVYNQTTFGNKTAYSIGYDSAWNVQQIYYYKNFKKRKNSLKTFIQVNPENFKEKVDVDEYRFTEFLGIYKKVKIYDYEDGKYRGVMLRRKFFKTEKIYGYDTDYTKYLEKKTINRKNRKIIHQYNSSGEIVSTQITKHDKRNEITESQQFEYDKLIQKSTFSYKVKLEQKAEDGLHELLNETND